MNIKTLIGSQLACLGLCGAATVPVTQEASSAVPVEDTRESLGRWVETRRAISKERTEWALAREMLTDRIAILEREIEAVRERIAAAEASITEADEKRNELVAGNDAIKETTLAMTTRVVELEDRTRTLLERVPDPVVERVRPLSQQFPGGGEETSLSLGQRFQNVIGVLNAINKFHREINVTSEVHMLADGTSAEVAAIYLGIGQGYYVTPSGEHAASGSGASGTWSWEPRDAAAESIAKAIAIYRNEEAAAFVQLPCRIQE